jgi:phosphoribosylglycinamide formyltransferase 1
MTHHSQPGLAIAVSGVGSILEAIVAAGLKPQLVLADRRCRGLEVAAAAGIPTELAERSFGSRFNRAEYTTHIAGILDRHGIETVAMAGFMTVLAPSLFSPNAYAGRILNTHPSLLPAFPGDHAVRDALAFGVKVTGCTVHIATAELDAGPILAQAAVDVLPGDTEATLQERIKRVERVLYPKAIQNFLDEDASSP